MHIHTKEKPEEKRRGRRGGKRVERGRRAAERRTTSLPHINDDFRRNPDCVMEDKSLLTIGDDFMLELRMFIENWQEWSAAPNHDFGSLRHRGHSVFWSIDCVERSDNRIPAHEPLNRETTKRILKIWKPGNLRWAV